MVHRNCGEESSVNNGFRDSYWHVLELAVRIIVDWNPEMDVCKSQKLFVEVFVASGAICMVRDKEREVN